MTTKITPKAKYPVKLVGKINWAYESGETIFDVVVKRAFLRVKGELVLQFEDKGYEYNASLRRIRGSHYEGQFSGYHGQKASPVKASCRLCQDEDGYLLFGNWFEDGYECRWWAELNGVRHLPDEGSISR